MRKLGWSLLALLLALAALRLLLPGWIRRDLDGRIASMGPYHGSIGEVNLHLWRGGYTLHDLRIDKLDAPGKEPFLIAPRTELTVSFAALLHGRLRGDVESYDATVNFIDGKTEGERQLGKGVNWSDELNILLPVEVDRIRVHNGTITFRNVASDPRVDLTMNHVESTVTNLSAAKSTTGKRVATLDTTATVLGDAPLETHATFDPANRFGDFDYHIRITHIQLVRANALARAYTGLDFAGGTGDFTMDLKASNGELKGEAQPVFKDLKLFSWKKDVEEEKKGPIKLLYQAAAQGVASLLKAPSSNDQIVTKVPISGRIGNSQIGGSQAIYEVLRHAFAEAYKEQLEHLEPSPDASKQ
ncbi:MAG TPA: DUF748 domain-containing protein [Dyella sp.]|uniref:DUF748 domain-containing protein n=1 Tax=Dyella sp. TaxID=1869338 RepID=UPI002BF2C899|nr:DUF748 domain-containing protein [Dyella sp.]HTV84786.1 DUF748 domain-containing protein [Dyella sp.]